MELPDIHFNKAEYIETVSVSFFVLKVIVLIHIYISSLFLFFKASGNRVSRHSVLCGSQNIVLNGKNIVQSEAIIRGDLANVRVGRHCVISSKAVIRPPFSKEISIIIVLSIVI